MINLQNDTQNPTQNNQVKAKHVIDITNASPTMLFNINTKQWDKELLALFEEYQIVLPKVVPSSGEIGKTYKGMLSKNNDYEIMIASAIGDQQAALFGQLCLKTCEVKNTYGTRCFILNKGWQEAIKRTCGWSTAIK